MSANATPTSEDEFRRLEALRRYEILDTPPDGAFDRITSLASRLLKTPLSIVSLVDHDRIWFKSHHGIDTEQVDRVPGLCASAILGNATYVLTDAAVDPRSMANPLVAGSMGVRFYAGVPLRTHDNFNLGVLCCLDFAPRTLSASDQSILEDLAAIVIDQMELRLAARRVDELHHELRSAHAELSHRASHDELTGLMNRHAITARLDEAAARSRVARQAMAVVMLDLDFFKNVNDQYGHLVGDHVLKVVATRLRASLRGGDALGRLGGEEFVAVLENCDLIAATAVADRCRNAISSRPIGLPDGSELALDMSISVGVAALGPLTSRSSCDMLALADEALYTAKRHGRDRVECVVG